MRMTTKTKHQDKYECDSRSVDINTDANEKTTGTSTTATATSGTSTATTAAAAVTAAATSSEFWENVQMFQSSTPCYKATRRAHAKVDGRSPQPL